MKGVHYIEYVANEAFEALLRRYDASKTLSCGPLGFSTKLVRPHKGSLEDFQKLNRGMWVGCVNLDKNQLSDKLKKNRFFKFQITWQKKYVVFVII